MRLFRPYDRRSAVRYAHEWAYGRNPRFYDYEDLGGDCTNFASQCLYAGGAVMNYTPTFGWYYISANEKAPAWTGTEFLYNFLTRGEGTVGPIARECAIEEIRPGGLVQLS
ncbi:MAG: amidase domain-containing protein, partial [Oscillibacter sp.]|nr:amidase domain-containing protein [Oscillibacter sp.]